MKKDYFKNVLNGLGKTTSKKQIGLNFITLKSYEYWIRALQHTKKYPDPSESISILPKESAFRILKGVSQHFELLNKAEDKHPKRAKKMESTPTDEFSEFFHEQKDSDNDEPYRC